MATTLTNSQRDPDAAFWAARNIPELAYVVVPGAEPGTRIGIVKRGEAGYYLTDYDRVSATPDLVDELVDRLNARLGVTKGQREAMAVGSLFGWEVPGADSNHYDNDGKLVRS